MAGTRSDVDALVLHPDDNVAVCLRDVAAGDEVTVDGRSLRAADDVPFGHKIALGSIEAGASVVKYGEVIGAATNDIATGCHVHVHNVRSLRGGSRR